MMSLRMFMSALILLILVAMGIVSNMGAYVAFMLNPVLLIGLMLCGVILFSDFYDPSTRNHR